MDTKKVPSKEVTLQIIKFFWNHSLKYRKEMVVFLLLIPINAVLISTLIPWFISQALNQLALPSSERLLTPLLIGVVVCAALGSILNYIGYGALFRHQAKTYASIVKQCFKILSLRGEQFYANQFTGALTKYSVDLPNAFASFQSTVIINSLPFVVRTLSGVVIVYFGGAPWLSLLLLTFSIVIVWTVYVGRKKRQSIRDKRREAQTAINSHLADVITNNQAMRTFAQWSREQKQNQKLVNIWRGLMLEDFKLVNKLANNLIRSSLALQIIFVLIMIYMVDQGLVTLGVAIFCVTYLTRFASELFGIGAMINQIESALIDARPMVEIMYKSAETTDSKKATILRVSKGEVVFDKVHFSYQDESDFHVFKNLSITINSGEKIGLVGPSGGGKTTITKLLLRLLDIQEGTIRIDGQDISKTTQQSLRKNIAYVPQESTLFHRSLADNISYGQDGATLTNIVRAAKQAHAHEFIQQLSDGYETLVGERGVKLSGGQRQRIAIARAILKNAPILVLDEATSALDSESEKLIQEALDKLMLNRTTIVIAHRLSTIQKMDRILVLDKGKVVEEGSHKELLQKNGTYAKLWAHQSGGFLEE